MANRRKRIANNFWQQQLIDANVSLKEMAELLECSYKYTVAYFTGFVHPAKETISAICELLSVPIDLGIKKFDEIYDAWGNEHKDYEKYSNTYRRKSVRNTDKNGSKKKAIKMGFWGHKLASSGISIKELAIKLDKPYSTVNAYFTGHVMPDVDIVKKLCILFNVDYDRGYQEFLKAHDNWGLIHADKYVRCGNTYKLAESVTPVKEKEPEEDQAEIPSDDLTMFDDCEKESPASKIKSKTTPTMDIISCQKLLYNVLSYDDFITILSMTTSYDELLEFVYDKVDYDTFIALIR